MSNLDAVIQDLVIANRILAREEVVDAYGHVSIRHPDNPKHFFLARSLAPDLVEPRDIVELGLSRTARPWHGGEDQHGRQPGSGSLVLRQPAGRRLTSRSPAVG